MKALIFNIRLNSLFSIRIPFTWQSALTYPLLPPSSVIGMIANAWQRYKNDKYPIEYLIELENVIECASSRLLSPCIIKSYTMSSIIKWQDLLGGKFTNALGRQFAYCRNMQSLAIFKDMIDTEILAALMSTPLTAGDSESTITLEDQPLVFDAKYESFEKETIIDTVFPAPFRVDNLVDGTGRLYFMHERCMKQKKNFSLLSFICPLQEDNGILKPSSLKIKCGKADKVINIQNLGFLIKSIYQKKMNNRNRKTN